MEASWLAGVDFVLDSYQAEMLLVGLVGFVEVLAGFYFYQLMWGH